MGLSMEKCLWTWGQTYPKTDRGLKVTVVNSRFNSYWPSYNSIHLFKPVCMQKVLTIDKKEVTSQSKLIWRAQRIKPLLLTCSNLKSS